MNENTAEIVGRLQNGIVFNHENEGHKLYSSFVEMERSSGTKDIIPIMIPEKLVEQALSLMTKYVNISGQIRSYKIRNDDGTYRLSLTLFAHSIHESEKSTLNNIFISGNVCHDPVYRITPFGREICDIMVSVNQRNRYNHIPCIAWGDEAKRASELKFGDPISVFGRIQSRDYQKKLENGEIVTKTAYELSAHSIETRN